MSANIGWSPRLTMLMACASPGSAFAYHLGLATFKPAVLRRGKATEAGVAQCVPVVEPASTAKAEPQLAIWLREGAR